MEQEWEFSNYEEGQGKKLSLSVEKETTVNWYTCEERQGKKLSLSVEKLIENSKEVTLNQGWRTKKYQ